MIQTMKKIMFGDRAECLSCNGRHQGYSLFGNHLCQICAAEIPWITFIRCDRCGRDIDCQDCEEASRFDTLPPVNRSAVRYNDRMKHWLAQYKYRGDERWCAVFAEMLSVAWHHHPCQTPEVDLVTYVPLSRQRLTERGFNQAGEIAARFAKQIDAPCRLLLERTRHSEKQSKYGRASRLANVKELYKRSEDGERVLTCLQPDKNRPLNIVLIDDVYTTGSTLGECGRAIGSIDIATNIFSLTWARS